MSLTVTDVQYNPGETVAVLLAIDDDGVTWRVAADWRPARDIAEALAHGEEVEIDPEPWSVLGIASRQS